ncbi:MAG: hypothetical protein Q9187_004698 [Circinaria calcarea]
MFSAVRGVDNCGSTVAEYTSLTFSFAPGELSTSEPARGPKAAPFNFADLPCPPASVIAANWYYYKPGMRYLPRFIPPPQIYQLHPHFNNCFAYPGSVYDPQFALTPQIALTPFTTAAGAPGGTRSVGPAPVPSIPNAAPLQTSTSPSGMNTIPGVATSIPTKGVSVLVPAPENYLEPDPHTQGPPPASQPSQGHSSQDLSTQTLPGIISSTENLLLPRPTPTEVDHTTAPIAIELNPSGPNIDPLERPALSSDNLAPPVIIYGTVFSLNPSIPITGTTLELPHAPSSVAITLSGQVFTHDSHPALLGTSTFDSDTGQAVTISGIPTLSPSQAGLVLGSTEIDVNGQAFTVAPTGFAVDSMTLLPGSPAITISGTIVASLDAEGTDLVIGTRTISLPKTTASVGLGGLIISGFRPIGEPSSSPIATTAKSNTTTNDGTIMPFSGNGGRRAEIG